MPINIWGMNPKTGNAECFALRFPPDEIPELMKKATAEGWWGLIAAPTNVDLSDDDRHGDTDDASILKFAK